MIANFLFVSDDKYVKNLGVCTYSVMHNTCPNADKVVMYVMDCGITEENKSRLTRQTERFDNAEIIFYDINLLLDFVVPKVETKWNRAIYGRLFLNEILDKYDGIDRIIYLDSDIIVNDSITELFEMDMQGKCIAAVIDGDEAPRKKALHMKESQSYVNSGVLVIDAKRWVELNAGQRIIEYINSVSKELQYPDQDAINYILCDEIMIIPLKYNFFWMICDRDVFKMVKSLELTYSTDEIYYALHNAKIIHFAGHDMWSMYGPSPIAIRAFIKYKKLSDWKECRRKFGGAREFLLWFSIFIKRKIYRD